MTTPDYDEGKTTLTLNTREIVGIPGFGRRQSEKVSDFYYSVASGHAPWKRVFQDTQWEIPGWSYSLNNVASFFARAFTLEAECARCAVSPKDLVNEERVVLSAGRLASPYDFPFYCVGKKMMEAVMQTKPIDQWDFNAFPLPFPCMTFLLPKGTDFCGEAMTHLIVFQRGVNGEEGHALKKTVFIGGMASFLPFLGVHSTDERGVLEVSSRAIESETMSKEKAEKAALSIMQVALNLVGVMYARKELIEPDRVLRVVGKRQTVVKRPRMVGFNYTYKTVSAKSEPTGRTVASHWRKAHWHTVLYGPGRSLKRLDWFEPVFVSSKI